MLRVMQKVVLRQLFSISINTVAIREKFRKWCTRAVQTTYICIMYMRQLVGFASSSNWRILYGMLMPGFFWRTKLMFWAGRSSHTISRRSLHLVSCQLRPSRKKLSRRAMQAC